MKLNLVRKSRTFGSFSVVEKVIFFGALTYAIFRTTRSLWLHAQPDLDMHDLRLLFEKWSTLFNRGPNFAAEVTYLPHVYCLLTPIFAWGWPITRTCAYILNVVAVIFIVCRLSFWAQLSNKKRLFFIVFYF